MIPATKPDTARFAPVQRNPRKARYPANEPTTPMEMMFAPRVERPPWARKRAWTRSAAALITTLTSGPTRIAAIAVPQGWEQVPAVGTGTGMQEMTNTTAARSPARGLKDGSERERVLS